MLEKEEDEEARNRTSSHGAAEGANSPLEELPDSFWVEAVAICIFPKSLGRCCGAHADCSRIIAYGG